MEKTKFWIVDEKLFHSKTEAEFHYQNTVRECACRSNGLYFSSFHHRCCDSVTEVNLATVLKDKKYRKFLDAKLEQLIKERNEQISQTNKIEKDIEEVKTEQSSF